MRGASAVAGHFGNGAGVTGEMLAQEMRCGKAIRSSFLGREDEAFGWEIATGLGCCGDPSASVGMTVSEIVPKRNDGRAAVGVPPYVFRMCGKQGGYGRMA